MLPKNGSTSRHWKVVVILLCTTQRERRGVVEYWFRALPNMRGVRSVDRCSCSFFRKRKKERQFSSFKLVNMSNFFVQFDVF